MENISIHNYEAYLLDFSENKLNPVQITDLKKFIVLHPELNIDLNDLSLPSLSKPSVQAEFKNSLRRSDLFVSEEVLINYLENNLTTEQKTKFETRLLTDPELAAELANYQRTILRPDNTRVYVEKVKLLKKEEDFIIHSPAISYLENQLSVSERLDFENTVRANRLTEKDFELLKKTILVPDLTICFENKAALKKETKLFILFDKRVLSSLAAAILLIFGLLLVFNTFIKTDLKPEPLGSVINNSNKAHIEDLLKRNESVVQKSESTLLKKSTPKAGLVAHLINKKEFVANKLNDSIIERQKVYGESPVNALALEKTPLKTNAEIKENSFKVQAENSAAIASAIKLELNQITHMEEVIDEEEVSVETDPKNQLWKKAVKLAQRVNNLGLRSINGAESSNDQYLLSFNSFSIEKK